MPYSEEGEHVYVSGKLRYREYEKAVGEGKNTVTMPVAEIHAAEIRRRRWWWLISQCEHRQG
jgi:hypothetical protein